MAAISVVLDENGYFTGSYCEVGDISNSIRVERPIFLKEDNIFKQMAYRYDGTTGVWTFDNVRYQYLLRQDSEQEEDDLVKKNKELEAKIKELEAKIDKVLEVTKSEG